MRSILVKKITMMNFKKFIEKTIECGDNVTSIFGQNYRGKSSVADAFSWVFFNKSSTGNTEGSQFRPRRYDEHGVNIDHVDVVVELELIVDGEDLKIKKVQRQNWVRHHGDDFDSYTGDETSYEWNDVPVAPTLHKKKVGEIISEDVFRMLSNPAAFPSLPAKKQREFLLKNIANITDEDVFATRPEFGLVKEAMGNKTLEELLAKTKKEISAYKKKQEELPIRIDQESKRIEDIDFSDKEKQLEKLNSDLADADKRYEDTSKVYEDMITLNTEKSQLKLKLQAIESDIQREHEAKKRNIRNIIDKANNDFKEIQERQSGVASALQIHEFRIQQNNEGLKKLREKFTLERAKEMDENSLICPTCGQKLPEDQADEVRKEFADKKAFAIREITASGNMIDRNNAKLKEEMESYKAQMKELSQKKIEVMRTENEHLEILKNLESSAPDPKQNNAWCEIHQQICELDKKITDIDTTDTDALRDKIRAERSDIQRAIDEVKKSLALKEVIENSKAAVEELREEMVMVTQSLANCEKLESMIDKFNKAKMDMLSERINDNFELVKWKLFEKQKNQKYAETCVCMVNGSCYGDNTTSATEKMLAGMDIIRTLHGVYGISAPIFLDDADLYNEWNIPDMGCQLIKLCVSEDEDLRVERED